MNKKKMQVYMLSSTFIENLGRIIPKENIILNEPMSRHTTFRVGGEAACLIKVPDSERLARLILFLEQTGHEFFLIGNGSNLLVSDSGYDGIILKLEERFEKVQTEGLKIIAGAAASLSQVAKQALEAGLTGMEFASGIPGTLGGAIVMNAGAYDGEMKQIVKEVNVMDQEGNILTLNNETMEFGYRSSVIRNRPFIVLSAVLELEEGNREEIGQKMKDLAEKRREKQPLEYASAGSTFKRPEGYFAGKLIMEAGLRGFSIGGAKVSDKHCGFIVNTGNATALDIYEVIQEVQERVKEQFGVWLEPEVIRLGKF